jgi:hypothetical protein
MHDAVAWHYLGEDDDQGMQPSESPLERVFRPGFTCQGNGRWTETNEAYRTEELGHLRDIALGKVQGCEALYTFLDSIKPTRRRRKLRS